MFSCQVVPPFFPLQKEDLQAAKLQRQEDGAARHVVVGLFRLDILAARTSRDLPARLEISERLWRDSATLTAVSFSVPAAA